MPPPPNRSTVSPDSARATVAIADLDALVAPADRAVVDAQVNVVTASPGAAVLVWGPEAVCLAYNRHYRSISSLRLNALGKPLFKAQPELEKGWKQKLEVAFGGSGTTLEGAVFASGADGAGSGVAGEQQIGWLIPVPGGEGGSHGVLALFLDASGAVEPMRRLLGAVAHDFREPLIGIQVVSERLARLPKPTRERCVEDMDRILELAQRMDRLVDDLGAFARRAGGGSGARLSLRPGDLGKLVKTACDKLNVARDRPAGSSPTLADAPSLRAQPVQINVAEVQGLWDEEAIQRIVTSLVTSARQHSPEGGSVFVEVQSGREGAMLSVRDEGPALRGEEAEQLFEPWKRGAAPGADRRRRGVGIGLVLARELVIAHGGRISSERPPQGGFMVRVAFPVPGAADPHAPGSRPPVAGNPGSGPRRA
jgi:signal transduction histidine kinase